MKVPSIPHIVLLFFLGGVFLHFLLAGARTFHAQGAGGEPGAAVAQGTFVFGGVIPVWWLCLYQPIQVPNGVFSACILVASIALYEWARHTIWGRRWRIVRARGSLRRATHRAESSRRSLRGVPAPCRDVLPSRHFSRAW
jgi:hypothetical protein